MSSGRSGLQQKPRRFRSATPPECSSRFGHAFSVTDSYGCVVSYPGPRNSYVAVERCVRRGCTAVRRTDGRPEARNADGTPAYTYGTMQSPESGPGNAKAGRTAAVRGNGRRSRKPKRRARPVQGAGAAS